MAALISHTTFDAANAYAQSVFGSRVLGFREDPDDPNEPGHEEFMIFAPGGSTRLLFVELPELRQLRNRAHLDLAPAESSRDQELARLLEIGATVVDDLRREDGAGWAVLADPEGTSSESWAATRSARR